MERGLAAPVSKGFIERAALLAHFVETVQKENRKIV
jgi:hypothetical protein